MKRTAIFVAIVAAAGVLLLGAWTRWQRPQWQFEQHPRAVLGHRAAMRPVVAASTAGVLYVAAVYHEGEHERLGLSMSHDGGDTFSALEPVSPPDAEVAGHGENGPSLALRGMSVYALWQQRTASGPQQVVFASGAMGQPFSAPVVVTDKSDASFNGFSSLGVAPNGDLYAVWLDGRQRTQGTFSVYLARSTDKGASFGINQLVGKSACPCCRPSIAFGNDGEVYVAWREVFDGDVRDVVVARSRDAGATFSAPVRVSHDGWVLHACPESGPVMAFSHDALYAAWFTAAAGKQEIRVAASRDGGQSFGAAHVASGEVLDPNHPAFSVGENGEVLLAFQGRQHRNDGDWSATQAFVTQIAADGAAAPPRELHLLGRSGAYPALAAAGGHRAFAAWTEPDNSGETHVVLARGRLTN